MKRLRDLAARNPIAGETIACTGKKRFGTWADAVSVATRKQDRIRKDRDLRQPYRCRHCGGYHLGHIDRHDTMRQRRPREPYGPD